MKWFALISVLLLSFNVHASVLFGTIKKIEMQLSQNRPDSALEDIRSLENGLKAEGAYEEYSDIVSSLKSIAYLQKLDTDNALTYAENAIAIMKTRPANDPLVAKYRGKILSLIKSIEQAYPYRVFDAYTGLSNKFYYLETRNNKTYKQYDSYFTIDHEASDGCVMDVTRYKINYSYTSSDGVFTKAEHYWSYNYKIDFSRVALLKRYVYNKTNDIRFIRLGYVKSPKSNRERIVRQRYKVRAKNDSTISHKETYEDYIDIEIGNEATPDSKINEIESLFRKKQTQCNPSIQGSDSTPGPSSDYKEILTKINAITTQKLSWESNGDRYTGHSNISYKPFNNRCGGRFIIEEVKRYQDDKQTAHRFYTTEITDPSAITVTFDRQRFYRNGKQQGYNVNGKAVDWAFYGWIENKAAPFITSKMYMLHDDGSKSKIQYNDLKAHTENIDFLTDPGYYQVRDLLKEFFRVIECD